MAAPNAINIIEEIKTTKGHKLIIFTTYTFDPVFFDHGLWRTLRANNPTAAIIVLVDANKFDSVSKDFTNITGVEYALLPIRSALFHPKTFIFVGGKHNRVFIGSHNLTLPGITHNLELSYLTENAKLVRTCLEYVERVCQKHLHSDNAWLMLINRILTEMKFVDYADEKAHLINNLNQPIIPQLIKYVKEELGYVDQITIFAPYFSGVDAILSAVNDGLKPKRVKICIQPRNHNLDVNQLPNTNNIELYSITQESAESRRMHSKFIIFNNSKKSIIMMGSPNFTKPALMEVPSSGNYEVAILLNYDEELLLQSFEIKKITSDYVKATTREGPLSFQLVIQQISMHTLTWHIWTS